MNNDVYVRLCSRLNEHLMGAPETKEILEILRTTFTPEEAALALTLSTKPQELSKIAETSSRNIKELRAMLEQMADKGLVFKKKVSDGSETQERYSLLPTAPGLWEVTFAKKERNARTEQLARLWQDYYDSGWGKEMHRAETPVTRIFPVESSISSQIEVLPYERASELMKLADVISVSHCPCRVSAEFAGKGCGKPTDVCLHFGNFAEFMIERGHGRKISKDEALDILEETEKAGLVHLTGNSWDAVYSICSCCSCCCTQLKAIKELSKPGAVATSRFMAVVNADECTVCGTCEDRCQVGAVVVMENLAVVDLEKCIGCGLCVTTCPAEAISLKEDSDYEGSIPTSKELFKTIIREKAQ
jgi:electron transport complex protein RnfB